MNATDKRSLNEIKDIPLSLLAIPPLPDIYGSKPVKEAGDNTLARQRKLGDEEDLFAKTAGMLEQLAKEGFKEYPQLEAAREFLYRKQAECGLMSAWSHWHDDRGDPTQAAQALETFLAAQNIRKVYHLDDPADPLLVYTSHLLTSLLGDENPYAFGSQQPLPAWIDRTLLNVFFLEYARLRQVVLAFRQGKLQAAASDAAELTEKTTAQISVPWLRLLAYELQADVLTAARQNKQYKAAAAMGDLGDLIGILNKWRRLWPEGEPIKGARFYEAQYQGKRAERIRWHLGEMALELHIQGNDKGARRILEAFTEAELPSTRMPGSHGASIQQLWIYLSAAGDKQARLVLELEHADETEVENWIETEDPYAMYGACPKAVLLSERSFVYTRSMSYGADDLRRYLRTELDQVGIYSVRVERFRRVYRHGQSDEQPSEWIWINANNADALGSLAFAIEVATSAIDGDLTWMIHTLIELDPVDPEAASWRKALQFVMSDITDVNKLRQRIYDDCSSALAKVE